MADSTCVVCGVTVPHERVQATKQMGAPCTCIQHGDQYQVVRTGFMVYGHKTAGECVIVDGEGENLRQAIHADGRRR